MQLRKLLFARLSAFHTFHGVSETPASMLIFDAPAHAESFFQDVDREVTAVPRDLVKLPEIGARHGLRFMPPAG